MLSKYYIMIDKYKKKQNDIKVNEFTHFMTK